MTELAEHCLDRTKVKMEWYNQYDYWLCATRGNVENLLFFGDVFLNTDNITILYFCSDKR